MAGMTDYLEQQVLTHIFRTGSFTKPTVLGIGLFTTMPIDAGTGGVEVSGNAYARQTLNPLDANWKDSSLATQGQTNNLSAITFPAATPAAWGTIVGVGIWDAASAGNLLFAQTLIRSGDTPLFYTAAITSNIFTAPGSAFANGDTVRLVGVAASNTGSALPGGFSVDTQYFVVSVSGATFSLAATSGGAAITVSSAGAGILYREGSKVVGIGDTFSFPTAKLVVALD